MNVVEKLHLLSEASIWETAEDGCCLNPSYEPQDIVLTRADLPNGKSISLLKSLLNSACENNCLYCPMRAGRDFRRAAFQPDEFAKLIIHLTQAGLIQGVFLSSGVSGGGVHTQDQLIDATRILRNMYKFNGYLHLKIMPGAEYDQIYACMLLADRVSINLEAPNEVRLKYLAPQKDFNSQLLNLIKTISEIKKSPPTPRNWKGRWPSSCTQFVMGAAGESDRELLETTQSLHRLYQLTRAYYSSFKPHPDTPLAHHAPVSYARERRLYQADFLIRDYGFNQEELIFNDQGNLPETQDPKRLWAEHHLRHQPVELNYASREELLRIPGIGPWSTAKILQIRRTQTIRELGSLAKIGVNTMRAQHFILLDGRQPARQLSLF